MAKQLWVSDAAYEYVRQKAFEARKPIGRMASELISERAKVMP
jgi:AmiR/NasT family two-component response regulator